MRSMSGMSKREKDDEINQFESLNGVRAEAVFFYFYFDFLTKFATATSPPDNFEVLHSINELVF